MQFQPIYATMQVDMPDSLSTLLESIVGIFMLLLGGYSLLKALKSLPSQDQKQQQQQKINKESDNNLRRITRYEHTDFDDDRSENLFDSVHGELSMDLRQDVELETGVEYFEDEDGDASSPSSRLVSSQPLAQSSTTATKPSFNPSSSSSSLSSQLSGSQKPRLKLNVKSLSVVDGEACMSLADVSIGGSLHQHDSNSHHHDHSHPFHEHCFNCLWYLCCPLECCRTRLFNSRCSRQLLALGIGIVHGVAGPGGVLGVVPAVQLRDWRFSALYLGTFCVSSTFVMGCFAALYGTCSDSISKSTDGNSGEWKRLGIEFFSAGLSILVGIVWLTLLSVGKLHDFFP